MWDAWLTAVPPAADVSREFALAHADISTILISDNLLYASRMNV
jgi:hypothetical protein